VRCDSTGTSCVDIAGATAKTYVATPDDVGGRLAVRVTATNAAGSVTSLSARTDAVVAVPPAATANPSVSGTPRDGETLTADPGRWTSTEPITVAFQWRRCDADGTGCADIAAATDPTYRATATDIGHTIRVAVTATNSGGSGAATSARTDTIAPAPPVNTAAPTVPTAARDGAELTADPGEWTGTATIRYAYQWQRCAAEMGECRDIDGADERTYTPVSADVGSQLRAVVTATNDAASTTATSGPTGVVAPIAPASTATPTIAGTARDGATLTANPGTWTGTDPIAFIYRWRRCDGDGQGCADIPGATRDTYVATAADVARTLRVIVTATNVAGSARATSDPTAAVDAVAPSVRTAPSIDGTARDGATLTADPGTWDGTVPVRFAYQWQRCDADGCADVAGATDSTYRQSADDVTGTLRVVVTATNAGGSQTAASARTGTVGAAPPVNTSAPSIDGTARDGETLTADPGRWGGTPPITFEYRWVRCDAIGGACERSTAPTSAPTRPPAPTSATRCALSSPPATMAAPSR
jgi:hypothetical protein